MLKHQYKWNEHNISISSYIPMEVYDVLVKKAKEQAQVSGKYCSLSQLVRDILIKYIRNGS